MLLDVGRAGRATQNFYLRGLGAGGAVKEAGHGETLQSHSFATFSATPDTPNRKFEPCPEAHEAKHPVLVQPGEYLATVLRQAAGSSSPRRSPATTFPPLRLWLRLSAFLFVATALAYRRGSSGQDWRTCKATRLHIMHHSLLSRTKKACINVCTGNDNGHKANDNLKIQNKHKYHHVQFTVIISIFNSTNSRHTHTHRACISFMFML